MKNVSAMALMVYLLFSAVKIFSQDFYNVNTINTIELTFEEPNWDYLLDKLFLEGNEERLLATVVVNGIKYDSVGVRYKGNSSYNPNQDKNPLNIKLDYIIEDQLHENYGTLKLANVYKDPSFIREVLGYEIAREYMPAGLANYANVYINNSYIGLYTSVQDVDKHFLRSHFSSDENAFFKGELASGGTQAYVIIWDYLGQDSSSYANYYELESEYGWGELINFLDVLNNNSESVEDVLNVDRHLWMLAFDILFVNLDSPVNFAHNYYLYQDDAGHFNPIIWDLNENFGVFSRLLHEDQLSINGLQQLDPFLNSTNSDFPIISKILSNPTYKKMYVAHMKTIMDDFLINGLYRTRALEIQEIIDDDVLNDPNKFYTYSDFKNNIDNAINIEGRPGQNESIIGITQLMDSRVAYLNSLSDFQAEKPVISEIKSPSNPSTNSNVYITANISGASSVQLAYRTGLTTDYKKIEMLDDGSNNDNAAGDGIYGALVATGTSGFQYYIYAENENAASFSPERAAFEFYSVTVSGDLVINEFMASNESIITDAYGDYDDWIEFYNNTENDIQLSGYFLSDDADDLTQWVFPDTFIAARSYLIVWADKDEEQEGLHANFKLSASGEAIYLSSSDTTIVDETSFGEQTSDISTGRYPNGTGTFVQMSPTFSSQNVDGMTDVASDQFTEIPTQFILEQNYPNPFNPATTICFSIPAANHVTLLIYNITGQLVATLVDEQLSPGNYEYQWNAVNMPSGIYFYTLTCGSMTQMKRMILLK